MSFPLTTVDLSAAVVGTSGTVSWTSIASQNAYAAQGTTPHVQLYNESGCGLQLAFSTGEQPFLPAGGWLSMAINPSCTSFTYTVLYVMGGPLVTSLIGVWYPPDEPVPATPILGNSPIGGTVGSINAQFLQGIGQSLQLTEFDNGSTPALLPTATANEGLYLGVRNASAVPVMVMNLQFGTPPSVGIAALVDIVYKINQYNGDGLQGNGVPTTVAVAQDILVTATTSQVIATYTPGANMLLRVSMNLLVNNGVSGNSLTASVSFKDVNGNARVQFLNFAGGGGATNTVGANATNSMANAYWGGMATLISAQSGTAVNVNYRDPTNTPNDKISAVIERLA